jgi:Zn-dependent protease with chaperone function
MSVPYFARLLCLCFAAFFLVHLALAALVTVLTGPAIRRAGRMDASAAAGFLAAVRLFPFVFAGIVAVFLCVPSYLWHEPEVSAEQIGIICLAASVLGAWTCCAGLFRGARGAIRSSRFLRNCEPALNSDLPVFMMTGVFRGRLLVSRGARVALTTEQLSAAIEHERAHGTHRDNLMRLLLLLAPDILPFVRGFGDLDRAWSRFAEWAADDRAVAGDRRRAVALAEALVRIAQLGAFPNRIIATSLLGEPHDLADRVDRLLEDRAPASAGPRWWPGVAIAVAVAPFALQPSALRIVHEALEVLAH